MLGTAGTFLLTTVMMDRLPDAGLVGIPVLLAASLVIAISGLSSAKALVQGDRRLAAQAAVGGALAFWAAPLLALAQRATDAPPGTEVLFLTTSSWAFLVTVAVVVVSSASLRIGSFASIAGATTALAGAAGLLANWERPSSFSPFVRYTEREILMLVAGVLFALGLMALWSALKAAPFRAVSATALIGASLLSVVGMLLQPPSPSMLSQSVVPLALLGLAHSAAVWGWLTVIDRRGPMAPAAGLMLVPAAITALSAVERATGVYGANPIVWAGAGAAVAVMVTGSVVMAAATLTGSASGHPSGAGVMEVLRDAGRRTKLLLAVCGVALAAGAVGLITSTLAASSRGVGVDGANFAADWLMVGAESAIGWVTFGAALLALASVAYAEIRSEALMGGITAVCTIVAASGAWMLRGTALHTLTRWIPAEVQQAYGTEYARMSVEAVVNPAIYVSLGLSILTALFVLISVSGPSARRDTTEEVSS